jgi:hypothetical protein
VSFAAKQVIGSFLLTESNLGAQIDGEKNGPHVFKKLHF